jgi:rhomboid family GlyGly-CTERM serine protease
MRSFRAALLPDLLLPLCAVLIAVFVYLVPSATLLFEFRGDLAYAEPWRFLTSSYTHWSVSHLYWDAFALLAAGVVVARINRVDFLVIALAGPVFITALLFALPSGLPSYRGLSGVDIALYAYGAAFLAVRAERRGFRLFGALMFVLLVAKVAYEFTSGATVFADSADFIPLPSSHAAGGVFGLIVLSVRLLRRRLSGNR